MYPPCMHDVARMRRYERRFPDGLEEMQRAWRVAFGFDRFELFDAAIRASLESDSMADWSALFSLAPDLDLRTSSPFRMDWPDSGFFRDRG